MQCCIQFQAFGVRKACRPDLLKGCRARLPGKAAGQGCRARLPGKAAGQDCRTKVHAMVQYAESMVKLDNNAVFSLF
jgi:hypothetical protein